MPDSRCAGLEMDFSPSVRRCDEISYRWRTIMKTSAVQKIAAPQPYLLSLLTVIFVCYVMPFCSLRVGSAGAALLFTVLFASYPDRLRSRNGSLTMAFCLLGFVWLCAAVTIALSFFGAK